MSFISGLIAIFQDVPAVMALLNRLADLIDNVFKTSNDQEVQKWLTDMEAVNARLVKAISQQQKTQAALDINDLIRRL